MRRCITVAVAMCCCLSVVSCHSVCLAQADIQVAEGIRIRLVADDDLVPDCTNVTADSSDRVYATGPGYVRRLVDQNADGVFDSFSEIIEGLKHGAHGLFCEGPWLYYVADRGVWKVRLAADGSRRESEPQRVLEVKTGGEHDAHAVRRGPDGYWYLMVGNGATEFFSRQKTDNPVVSNPRAGAIWRISDDWQTLEVWAHGFRNAYDFDFAPAGTMVTFDSDDERDVSLPWYRPTRVFAVRQGDDAGWMSRSWKRPDYDLGMPQVLAEFGRGSPTGVVRYRGARLPSRFANGSFVLDWTFGRVLFVTDLGQTEVVAQPSGTAGFAVTDIVELKDGRLIISVGGRGSRGGLYELDATNPNLKSTTADFDWKPIPAQRANIEKRVLALRAQQQTGISPDDLQTVVDQLSRIDATAASSEPSVFALLTLLCEGCGGLGEASANDPRPAVQKAAIFDSLRSQLEPNFDPSLKRSLTSLLINIIQQEAAALSIRTEAVRALAVIEADEPTALSVVLRDLQACDDPTDKLHRLFALGRLKGVRDTAATQQIVQAMLDIPLLIAESGCKVDYSWAPRLAECFAALQDRDQRLAQALVTHPTFGHPVHLVWAEALPSEQLPVACARLLKNPVSQDDPAVAMFVAQSNHDIDSKTLSRWLKNEATKPAAWLHLSHHPSAAVAEELQLAAHAFDSDVRKAARAALGQLQIEVIENPLTSASAEQWLSLIPQILEHKGDPSAGEKLFGVRQCAKCHNAAKALGPSLAGISKRFSDSDVLRATFDPSQTVPDRYRAIQVLTEAGEVLTGLKVYESVDGLTLMTADAKTVRINADAIAQQQFMALSLMPEGLLDGLSQQQVADLLAYLRGL